MDVHYTRQVTVSIVMKIISYLVIKAFYFKLIKNYLLEYNEFMTFIHIKFFRSTNMKQIIAFLLAILPTFSFADYWPERVLEAIDVKQAAFCNISGSYNTEALKARNSRNQIKMKRVRDERAENLTAIIPDQKFTDWVVMIKEVELLEDGTASFTSYLNCDVELSTDRKIDIENRIRPDSLIFKQLGQVDLHDFVLVSGSFTRAFEGEDVYTKTDGEETIQDLKVDYKIKVDSLVRFD